MYKLIITAIIFISGNFCNAEWLMIEANHENTKVIELINLDHVKKLKIDQDGVHKIEFVDGQDMIFVRPPFGKQKQYIATPRKFTILKSLDMYTMIKETFKSSYKNYFNSLKSIITQ